MIHLIVGPPGGSATKRAADVLAGMRPDEEPTLLVDVAAVSGNFRPTRHNFDMAIVNNPAAVTAILKRRSGRP